MSKPKSNCKVEPDGYTLRGDSAILSYQIHLSRELFNKLKVKAAARNMDVDDYVAKEAILKRLEELLEA